MEYQSIASTAALVLLLTQGPAYGEDYVLGLPASLTQEVATQITDTTLALAEGLQQGDRLVIFHADEPLRLIVDIRVTERNRNRRRREISMPLGQFSDYMVEQYGISDVTGDEHIMLPQFLSEISTQTLAATDPQNRNVCILIVGDAQFSDPREETFSMLEGRFPSDGFIIGSQSQSPFGTADRQGFLKGMNVHFAYTDTEWVSDVHRLRTQRAWWLFVKAQDGMLGTFTSDLATAMERWKNCDAKSGRSFSYDTTRDMRVMIEWNRAPAPIVEEATIVEDPVIPPSNEPLLANDDWLRREDIARSSEQPDSLSGSLKLGIRWGDNQACQGVDMDLYIRSSSRLEYLYFANKTTADGRFNKDIRATSQLGMSNGMEYVDLTDIQDLSTLEIMVNHYAGNCRGGVNGFVRAYFNGVVYEAPFATQANEGNRGGQRSSSGSSSYWAVVDPQELFNIN